MTETLGVLAVIATVIFIAFFYRYLFRRAWEQDMEDAKRINMSHMKESEDGDS